MKWFDSWIQRCYNRARERDQLVEVEGWDDSPKRGRLGRLGRGNPTPSGPVSSTRRVEHNYDDETVITFKVYGANGGKIVETSRYDDKKDGESIRRYVIDENADLADSLGKIVTMEYLR
jgi:hypothetical protein